MTKQPRSATFPLACLAVVLVVMAWSLWKPFDVATWFLEVMPLLVAIPAFAATRRTFPWTNLAYGLVAVHGIVLMVGGHYTYALVPAGDWVKEAFGFERNHYDRLGHVTQGFVPAILFREYLSRRSPVRASAHPGWLFFFTTSICLAVSACYEFLEWAVAVFGPNEQGIAFLGTQGDEWDTQWDMFLCLLGAVAAQLLLRRTHDRQMSRLAL